MRVTVDVAPTVTGRAESPEPPGNTGCWWMGGRIMMRGRHFALLAILSVCSLSVGVVEPVAASGGFSITASPSLVPAFDVGIANYAVRCAGSATTHIETTGAGPVVIGGKHFASPVALDVPLVPGQSLTFAQGKSSYVVRCLPSDFPDYSSVRSGKPQVRGLLVTPTINFTGPAGHYVVAFDPQGVPVWWYRDQVAAGTPVDAKFLDKSTIGWSSGGAFRVYSLDGVAKQTFTAAGGFLDPHDFQVLPNGNYLGIAYVPHDNVDLSSWGLSDQAQITDSEILELDADSNIVWRWSTADHIDVATENANWHANFPDVVHMNSVQYVGNNEIIFSARHLDAVYAIDMTTGSVMWKLGGTKTTQSLAIAGDAYATTSDPATLFSGQHDARLFGRTLTVQDNGTQFTRPVRALRFTLNATTRTATEKESVTDEQFPTPAFCCGGAVRLGTGDWLTSWGTSKYAAELSPTGSHVLTVSYAPYSSYRVAPVLATSSVLRQGMDAGVGAPGQADARLNARQGLERLFHLTGWSARYPGPESRRSACRRTRRPAGRRCGP